MRIASGFTALEELPWERINDKIERRVLTGEQGMVVWWKIKAGARAASHSHPHEQIVWMLKGRMDFRIGNETRSMTQVMWLSSRATWSTKASFRRTLRSLMCFRHRVKIS